MTITINSHKTFLVLLSVLVLLYAANIFVTGKLSKALIDEPVALVFVTIDAPEGTCEKCVDSERIIEVIDKSHNVSYDITSVAADSAIAQKYIDMYSIDSLPAVIVSGDVTNEKIIGAWSSFGGRVDEDKIIIAGIVPFYDIASEAVQGITDVVLLTDATCSACFDANAYLNMLQRFGLVTGTVMIYDISSEEGKSYVDTYTIAKVPALLISPDARVYANLVNSWGQVGTVSDDGWFVFREVQKLSTEFKSL